MKPSVCNALKLVEGGLPVAVAAKQAGVSRQAVYLAKAKPKIAGRTCSECSKAIAEDARPEASTCSGACRVKRYRRLAAEKKAERPTRVAEERRKLGLPI
jgi:predicted nucleic acid-binding Zn ribbon protein